MADWGKTQDGCPQRRRYVINESMSIVRNTASSKENAVDMVS